MKKIIFMFSFLACAACSSKGIDGEYNRIEQTAFEQTNGMSSGLIVADQGAKVTLKNSWGDVALNTVKKEEKLVIQYQNQDAFLLEQKGNVITLTDVDNPDQTYKFKKD